MVNIEDEKGPDSKIVGVPASEPRMSEIQTLASIPNHTRLEVPRHN